MAVFDEIQQRLTDQGIAEGVTGWECWSNWMPDEPDRVILIKEIPGQEPQDFSDTDFVQFEIRVRGAKNDTLLAETKINDVFVDLHRMGPATLSGVSYGGVRALSKPGWFRADQNQRDEFIMTLEALRART